MLVAEGSLLTDGWRVSPLSRDYRGCRADVTTPVEPLGQHDDADNDGDGDERDLASSRGAHDAAAGTWTIACCICVTSAALGANPRTEPDVGGLGAA